MGLRARFEGLDHPAIVLAVAELLAYFLFLLVVFVALFLLPWLLVGGI